MTMRSITIIISLFMTASALTGCDNSRSFRDLKIYVDHINQTAADPPKTKAGASQSQPVPAIFHAGQLRSPFENSTLAGQGKPASNNPLQLYPITMLRFVGVIEQDKIDYGFILTPDNKVYPVKQGDLIGDHYGKVVSITQQKINVMEENASNGGSPIQRIITLQLKDEHE